MGLGGVDEKVFLSMAYVMHLVVGSWLAGLVGCYGVRCNFRGIFCNFTLSYLCTVQISVFASSYSLIRSYRFYEFMHCNRSIVNYIRSYSKNENIYN